MGGIVTLAGWLAIKLLKGLPDAALKLRGYDGGRIRGDCLPDGTGYGSVVFVG